MSWVQESGRRRHHKVVLVWVGSYAHWSRPTPTKSAAPGSAHMQGRAPAIQLSWD